MSHRKTESDEKERNGTDLDREDDLSEEMKEAGKDPDEKICDETKERPSIEKSAKEEEMEVKYLRLAADFMNYKKRSEKEKYDVIAYANEKIMISLLDILDNFERALFHKEEDTNPFLEGMVLIHKQLMTALKNAGLEEIQAVGSIFDPEYHDAIMVDEGSAMEEGRVTEELQKGYTLHNRVIRHSKVKVAQ